MRRNRQLPIDEETHGEPTMKHRKNLFTILTIILLLPLLFISCAEKVTDENRWNDDGSCIVFTRYYRQLKETREFTSKEPLLVFEEKGRIQVFDAHKKAVFRTKNGKAFFHHIAELQDEYGFEAIPIYSTCSAADKSELLCEILNDETLAKWLNEETTKTENSRCDTYALLCENGRRVRFFSGVRYSWCVCQGG